MSLNTSLLTAASLVFSAYAAFAAETAPHRILCPPEGFEDKLVIHQLYVGQGDSALIHTPSGQLVLIDGGESENGHEVIVPTLEQCYGKKAPVKKIDYIVVTHPHSDHFGGLLSIIQAGKYEIGTVLVPSTQLEKGETGGDFKKLLTAVSALASHGTRLVIAEPTDHLIVDPKVTFDIVVTDGKVAGKPDGGPDAANLATTPDGFNRDDNSVSIGMIVKFGTFKFFTAGDITGGKTATGAIHPDVEDAVAGVVERVDVYKASHHGSDTSNKPKLMQALSPTNVLVSVGSGGKNLSAFHLPRREALATLNGLPSVQNIFLTSQGQSADILPVGDFSSLPKVHDLGGMQGSDLIVTTDSSGSSYKITGVGFESAVFQAGK